MRHQYGFGPACDDELWVFGAQRPGYPKTNDLTLEDINVFVAFLRKQDVKRIVCLLDQDQLSYYELFWPGGLIGHYRDVFGGERVLHAPVADYQLCPHRMLIDIILPVLCASVEAREKVLVLCWGGIGRTGHVLAAWLAYSRDLEPRQAVRLVKGTGRNPCEAVDRGPAKAQELFDLLTAANAAGSAKRQLG